MLVRSILSGQNRGTCNRYALYLASQSCGTNLYPMANCEEGKKRKEALHSIPCSLILASSTIHPPPSFHFPLALCALLFRPCPHRNLGALNNKALHGVFSQLLLYCFCCGRSDKQTEMADGRGYKFRVVQKNCTLFERSCPQCCQAK